MNTQFTPIQKIITEMQKFIFGANYYIISLFPHKIIRNKNYIHTQKEVSRDVCNLKDIKLKIKEIY